MRKYLAALVAVLLLSIPLPSQAQEVPCPNPERPIHYMPFCLTHTEYLAVTTQAPAPVDPGPVYVAPIDLVRTLAYYYWPDWAAERMVRIAECESHYAPSAVNKRSGAAGIWQIMPFWKRVWPGDYLDPWTNAAVAYQIWLEQGFGAWVCRG